MNKTKQLWSSFSTGPPLSSIFPPEVQEKIEKKKKKKACHAAGKGKQRQNKAKLQQNPQQQQNSSWPFE